jgi:thiamine pyrophosphate-dependent acetolactate synthase large subunit-like protein
MSPPRAPRTLAVADACRLIGAARVDEVAVLSMSAIAFWPNVRAADYRLMGLMGGAASIGLGLAVGRPDRDIWVLDGDGSLLMQLGSLAAVAGAGVRNFTHFVIDNGMYAISGGQPMPADVDWAKLALAAGYTRATTCTSIDELHRALAPAEPAGPRLVAIRCRAERPPYPPNAFDVDPRQEAHRLHAALG